MVTLQEIEAFDSSPQKSGSDEVRYLCSLSADCRDKPRDAAHRSLGVNTRTGFYICHRCGAKGKLKEFWEDKPKFTQKQRAGNQLQSIFAAPPTPDDGKETEHLSDNYAEKFLSYQTSFNGSNGERYLQKRAIPPEISNAAGCGFAANWEHWEKRDGKWLLAGIDRRVVFPIRDAENNLAAIHGRAIDDEHLHSPKITKGDKSAGVFRAAPDALEAQVVAICEGAADALALQTCGVAAIAMTGTTAPDWLFKKLAFKAVLIATDADEAGDRAALKLVDELERVGAKTFRLRPRTAKDWAEVLENNAPEKLINFFQPFAANATDEQKVNAAWQWHIEKKEKLARFAAQLIKDLEVRQILLNRMKTD